MDDAPRHQCMIYAGSPSLQIPSVCEILIDRLSAGYRCLYLNSPNIVSEMESCLVAAGIDLREQAERGALLLSSDQSHIIDGKFDIEPMLAKLKSAAQHSRVDGFVGLWASGDMTWEFGDEKNLDKLLEYECKLEQLFHEVPELQGICQYHLETLPRKIIQEALYVHQGVFINETLSRVNPFYISPEILSHRPPVTSESKLQEMLERIGLPT